VKTICLCNHKGGVAKTTSAYHLGLLLAECQIRTLLVDLDPQANLTERFALGRLDLTVADVLGGVPGVTMDDAIIDVERSLSLCPSEFQLANVATALLSDAVRGRTALARALRSVADGYDVTIIDCPPEAGILLVNALLAGDGVLLPAEPEADALAGAARVVEIIEQIRVEFERERPAILGAVATRIDLRTNRHADGLELMRKSATAPLWAEIPLRNGDGREQSLQVAYRPVATELILWLERWAHEEGR